jgi:acetylornithine deacetylase
MRGETFRAGGLGAVVGVNAIDKGVDMFLAMRKLEDEWGQTKRHPLFRPGHFTIHPGVVIGGTKGVLVPFFVSEFMTIEYCCWYHPEEDPEAVQREIEAHVQRAAQLDPWLREHPPVIDWKLNCPAFSVDPKHPICAALGDAHKIAAIGTRFAGRPQVNVSAIEKTAVPEPCGVPTVAMARATFAAHARREHVSSTVRHGHEDVRAPCARLVRR